MKHIILLIFGFSLISDLYGQKFSSGVYVNKWGEKIEINTDSTFVYEINFDLFHDKVFGKWNTKKDTIYLNQIIIYDTVYVNYKVGDVLGSPVFATKKELVRSLDNKLDISNVENEIFISESSLNKSNFKINKLVFKQNKLFLIDIDGKILNKKYRHPITNKKVAGYFYKIE